MAFPTIPTVASGDLLSSTTSTASTTHTFPNLSSLRGGAGPVSGDLLIAICVQYQGGNANTEFSSWGASFTETRDDATVTALDQAIGVAHKIATGSETGTFTVTSAHSFKSVNFLMRIPAGTWHGTTIPEVLPVVRATGAVADPGAFDPTNWGTEDTLWISVAGHSETTTTGTAPTLTASPTNYSGDLIVARSADAVGNITAGVGFRQLNAASEDVGTWSASNATRGNGAATVIAIRPAPPTISDTGLTITDSISRAFPRTINSTGLTITDSIGRLFTKIIEDSGMNLTNGSVINSIALANIGNNTTQQTSVKFIPTTSITVDSIVTSLTKQGTPIDTIQLQIQSDSSGSPSGSAIATSDEHSVSGIGFVTFDFASDVALTGGTAYWLVLQRTGAQDVNNYYKSATETSAVTSVFPGRKIYDGASWSSLFTSALPWVNIQIGDSISANKTVGGGGGSVSRNITDTGLTVTSTLTANRNHSIYDAAFTNAWFPNTSILDSFTYSSGALNGRGDWNATPIGPFSGLQVGTNFANTINPSAATCGSFTTTTYGPDCEAYYDITQKDTTNPTFIARVLVRMQNPTSSSTAGRQGYEIHVAGNGTWTISVANGTTVVDLITFLQPIVNGDKIGIQAIGSKINAWWYDSSTSLWKLVGTVNDTTVSAAGNIGIALQGGASTLWTVDNLGGGNYPSGITDSVTSQKTKSASLADTGLTNTSTLVTNRTRNVSDTGLTITSSTVTNVTRTKIDTGLTVTDSMVSNRNRALTDTGLTNTDSLTRTATHPRTISDTGLTNSDTLVHSVIHADSDTGLNVSDSLQKSATKNITDIGLTLTDSVASSRTRAKTDTGLTNTDSIAVSSVHSRSISDTGLTNTDSSVSNRNRVFATTGLTNSDSISETAIHNRAISDTGLTNTDTLVHAVIHADSDTGLNLSDTLQKSASKNITDTGATITDSATSNRTRVFSDTGLTNTDSIARVNNTNRSITDTGVTITDSSVTSRTRAFSDTGLTITDSISRSAVHNIATSSTGLTISDSLVHSVIRSDSDTGLNLSDSLNKSAAKNISDTGLTESDSSIINIVRTFADTGLANADSIVRVNNTARSITDTGIGGGGGSAFDNFNRADGGLGANWDSYAEGLGATVPTIHSNEAIGNVILANSSESFALWNADTFGSNQFSEFAVGEINLQVNNWLGSIVRASDQDHYYLLIYFLTGGTYSLNLFKKTASLTYAQLGSVNLSGALDVGDTVRLEAESSTIRALVNGVEKLSITDTTYTNGGAGISIFTEGATGSLDNWAGGDLNVAGITDSFITNRNRIFTDIGLTNSDSIAETASHNISVSDAGLTLIDTLVHQVTRPDADTGLTINDSTSSTASHFRNISDTGLILTDVITLAGGISISDTGLTNSDSAAITALHFRTASDTGLTISDALSSSRSRSIADTGLTNTDSISRTASHNISISDIGLTNSDTLNHSIVRSDADTGLNISDAIQKTARHNISDTGLSESDSISTSSSGSISISDTGLTLSDSISRAAVHARAISDTGLTISDSIAPQVSRPRTITDTGLTESDSIARIATHSRSITDSLTFSDSLQHHVYKTDADTGLTISDTLVRGGTAFLSDTGITISDSLRKLASKSISSIGLNLTDSVTNLPIYYRTISDTGLSLSDSIAFVKTSQTIPISDTGLVLSDFIQKRDEIFISDSGMVFSDILIFVPQVIKGFYKVSLGRDGYYRSYVTRWRS